MCIFKVEVPRGLPPLLVVGIEPTRPDAQKGGPMFSFSLSLSLFPAFQYRPFSFLSLFRRGSLLRCALCLVLLVSA